MYHREERGRALPGFMRPSWSLQMVASWRLGGWHRRIRLKNFLI